MKACMRVVWLIVLSLAPMVFNAPARAIEVSGDITADTVWDAGMSPLTVTGDLVIAEGVTLTIGPGVRVEFANASSSSDGYHIEVNGALTARGSEGDPIVFTAADTSRYWEYINFTATAAAWDEGTETGSILEYCIVEYAGNGSDGAHGQAAVMMTGGAGTIRNCVVRYSKTAGVLGYGGVFDIASNRIHDTTCAIRLIEPLAAQITDNHLIENEQGMDVDSASHGVEISGNTVVAASSEGNGACLALNLLYHDRLSAYRWRQIEGPAVTLSDAQALAPTFTVPDVSADESFVFQLTVTSLDGLVATDTVTIQTGWDNQAPLADAGADQAVIEGVRVMLDGTSSFDADDGIASWDWLQTSGPAVVLSESATTGQAYFTAPAVTGPVDEVVIVELSVTDSGGLTDRDTVVIRVADSVVHPEPVAEAGPLQSVDENTAVTLAGTLANDPADNITVVSWFWERTAGDYVALTGTTTQNAAFTVTDVTEDGASYTFRLTVTDDEGNQSTDTVIVNVLDTDDATPNQPPVAGADITLNAVSITTVSEGTTNVILDGYANSTDPELNIDSYVWEQVAGPTVTLTSTGSTGEKRFTAPDVSEDTTLRFRLTVTDDGGLRSVDEIDLVVEWTNQPPVARAGDDQTVNEGLRVLLDGSASTDDKAVTSYLWSQISGSPVTLFNADAAKAYFATPEITADETLVFVLTVNDGAFPVQDLVHVRVLAADDPPVADAGPDRVVAWDTDPVTLDGSASEDPEDPVTGIVSYLWEQIAGPDVTLFDADTAAPHFTAPPAGSDDYVSLTFQLTVTDGSAQTGVDTVVVNVTADPTGTVPTAVAGPGQTAPPGTVVTLSAAGSSDPQALPVLSVTGNDFSLDDDTENANALSLARALNANVDLTITGNNLVQVLGRHLVFLHDFGSPAGAIAMTGNWWGLADTAAIAALIYDGADNALLPEVTFDPFEAGVLDGAGSSLSYPPMVILGDDLTVDPDEPVTLDGTDTYDPDDHLTYLWEQTGGKAVTLNGDHTVTATFNAPAVTDEDEEGAGVLTFRLTVTDPQGFSDSRTLSVTINTEEDEDAASYGSSGCFIGTGLGRGWF